MLILQYLVTDIRILLEQREDERHILCDIYNNLEATYSVHAGRSLYIWMTFKILHFKFYPYVLQLIIINSIAGNSLKATVYMNVGINDREDTITKARTKT